MENHNSIGERLKYARTLRKMSQTQLGKKIGVTQGTIAQIENGDTKNSSHLFDLSVVLKISMKWLQTGKGEMESQNTTPSNYDVGIADDFLDDWEEIPYYYAKGACGNGSDNHTDEIRGILRKEKSWFVKYGVKPENLFTVYADGDSNADFIMDGDMVIFDRSKTTPKDGTMFFIKHPAGDRIKTLRQKANGNWLLCSRNHDKTRFPDEEITAEEAQLIEILGEYVYRQG